MSSCKVGLARGEDRLHTLYIPDATRNVSYRHTGIDAQLATATAVGTLPL